MWHIADNEVKADKQECRQESVEGGYETAGVGDCDVIHRAFMVLQKYSRIVVRFAKRDERTVQITTSSG
jgi:hypothetical protein